MTEEITECYETEMGVPTFTMELPDKSMMLAYSSFRNAAFEGNRITIELYDWMIIISGKHLSSLWEHLQMQDIRVIRSNSDSVDGECFVSSIEVKQHEEAASEQDSQQLESLVALLSQQGVRQLEFHALSFSFQQDVLRVASDAALLVGAFA